MLCTCGTHSMVRGMWQGKQIRLCTHCGRMVAIDYARGGIKVLWRNAYAGRMAG